MEKINGIRLCRKLLKETVLGNWLVIYGEYLSRLDNQ